MSGLSSTVARIHDNLRLAKAGDAEHRSAVESPDTASLISQLARLERALLRGSNATRSSLAGDGGKPPVWDAIIPVANATSTLKDAELVAFTRTLLLLDEAELIARFGVPTGIEVASSGKEIWVYEDDGNDILVQFNLHAGRVIGVW